MKKIILILITFVVAINVNSQDTVQLHNGVYKSEEKVVEEEKIFSEKMILEGTTVEELNYLRENGLKEYTVIISKNEEVEEKDWNYNLIVTERKRRVYVDGDKLKAEEYESINSYSRKFSMVLIYIMILFSVIGIMFGKRLDKFLHFNNIYNYIKFFSLSVFICALVPFLVSFIIYSLGVGLVVLWSGIILASIITAIYIDAKCFEGFTSFIVIFVGAILTGIISWAGNFGTVDTLIVGSTVFWCLALLFTLIADY